MQVVIDTNVLVSGLISSSGSPGRIVNAILQGDIVPIMSEATFAELEEVLTVRDCSPTFATHLSPHFSC